MDIGAATGKADAVTYSIQKGDALEVLDAMPSRSVDLVLTDPPYIIGAVSAGNMASKSGGWGDMMNSSRWFTTWYQQCDRLLKRDGAIWTFCNWRTLPVVMRAALDAGIPVASLLVWDKEHYGHGGHRSLRSQHEFVALLPMPEFVVPDRGISDVWSVRWIPQHMNTTGHPAEKPVALLRRIIDVSFTDPRGKTILDPFMGSGSTIRAALDAGCCAVGIECEQRWIDVAELRCAQGELLGGAA